MRSSSPACRWGGGETMSVGTRTSKANSLPPVSAPVHKNSMRSLLIGFSICLAEVPKVPPCQRTIRVEARARDCFSAFSVSLASSRPSHVPVGDADYLFLVDDLETEALVEADVFRLVGLQVGGFFGGVHLRAEEPHELGADVQGT